MSFIIYPNVSVIRSLNLRVNIKCEFFTDVNNSVRLENGVQMFFPSSLLENVWHADNKSKRMDIKANAIARAHDTHWRKEKKNTRRNEVQSGCVEEVNRQSWFPLSIVSMMSMAFHTYIHTECISFYVDVYSLNHYRMAMKFLLALPAKIIFSRRVAHNANIRSFNFNAAAVAVAATYSKLLMLIIISSFGFRVVSDFCTFFAVMFQHFSKSIYLRMPQCNGEKSEKNGISCQPKPE